jgi:hypothetical protein
VAPAQFVRQFMGNSSVCSTGGLPTGPEFSIKYPDARGALEGKTVVFHLEHEGKLIQLVGRFIVHGPPDRQWLDLECRELHYPEEPSNTLGYCYRLSQGYVDSIARAAEEAGAEFELRIPILDRHRVVAPSPRQP